MPWLRFFKNDNWIIFGSVFLLSGFGLFGILSATFGKYQLVYFYRQLAFLLASLVVFFAVRLINWRFFKNEGKTLLVFYIISSVSLAGLILTGKAIRGAASWYKVGSLGFEPVEIVKIILVLLLAKYFSLRHVEIFRARHVVASFVYAALPLVLVLLQPDLGSAIILLGIWLGMVLLAGIKLRHLATVAVLGILAASLAWVFVLHPYQKQRISSFLNPERDPRGSSYNLQQSLISVGSGGFWGKGLGRGSQTQMGFLPENHSDFIFASVSEELGFMGASIIIFLYAVFVLSLGWVGRKLPDNFSRLATLGFAVMFLIEFAINAGMNIGLLPVTGTPLPFLSYGGSNLLSSFIALGIISGLARGG